jgi:hypothetical protein
VIMNGNHHRMLILLSGPPGINEDSCIR